MSNKRIEHPVAGRSLKIHEWQINAVCGNTVAAYLLAYFEAMHNVDMQLASKSKSSDHDPAMEWKFHSIYNLIKATLGTGNEKSVRKAIDMLKNLGFISIENNQRRKYEEKLRLNIETINLWIESNWI